MSLIAEQASPTAAVPLERTSFSESLREMARGSTELKDEGFHHSNHSDAVAAHQLESVKGKLVGFDTDPSGPNIMNGKLTKDAAVALGYQSLAKAEAEKQILSISRDGPGSDKAACMQYWKTVLSATINEAGAVLVKNKKELEQLAKLMKAIPNLRPKRLLLTMSSDIPSALKGVPTTILGRVNDSTKDRLAQSQLQVESAMESEVQMETSQTPISSQDEASLQFAS